MRFNTNKTTIQVAGCTLDASAKIYAGRVDSIHIQAYKMLGGLGRAEKDRGKSIILNCYYCLACSMHHCQP